jgi:hypothetical protein
LLAAIHFDLAVRIQGDNRMLGTQAIEMGLKEMGRGLAIAGMASRGDEDRKRLIAQLIYLHLF